MKLIILASHPVQYHAPVFRAVSQQLAQQGDDCLVVYLSDFSIQGYRDAEFGQAVAWDEPLLEGYRSRILNENQTQQPRSFGELQAPGWDRVLRDEQPTRVLVTNLNYRGAVSVSLQARLAGVPCTLRVETNDRAVSRSRVKSLARSLWYRSLYSALFDSAIAIGSLNRDHLTGHGIAPERVGLAYYCVPDRFQPIPTDEKPQLRQQLRQELNLDDRTAILFSGKLIPKKNPQLLLDAIAQLPEASQNRLAVIFLGAGELESQLRQMAANLPAVKIHLAGFKNQQELPPYYLAADALVLPSSQAGETWGLVVNEAMQAGLPCIVTQQVGCAVDFKDFPTFQAIPQPEATSLAAAIANLIDLPREFERYASLMKSFSVEACGERIASFLQGLDA